MFRDRGSRRGAAQVLALPERPEGAGSPRLGRAALRQALPLLAALLLLFLLGDRVRAIDPGAVRDAFGRIPPLAWLLAGTATLVSFLALGRYDAVIHRFLGTGVAPQAAGRAGMTAIAISQTAGFGLVTGALVRWRMLPGQSLWQAVRLTLAVTVWFLAAWSVVAAGAVLLCAGAGPLAAPPARFLAGVVLLAAAAGLVLSLAAPRLAVAGRAFRVPALPALGRLQLYAAADTLAAAAALWVLLPPEAAVAPGALVAAYLVALGAGIVLATPGGLGPFECALVAFLPGAERDALLAAVLAFRLVYFAVPALLAVLVLGFGPRAMDRAFARGGAADPDTRRAGPVLIAPPAVAAAPGVAALLAGAARAECGVLRQGEHALLLAPGGRNGWVLGRGRQALVALFDPLAGGRGAGATLPGLARAAREAGLVPCLYKCSARTAAAARTAGWTVRAVAAEHLLDPRAARGFAGPDHAGLRRKLRKAAKSGVRVERALPGTAPMAELAGVAAAWARARGGERGFSMGRFAPAYLAGARLYLARCGDRVVGFASFHEARGEGGRGEWVLDLMRALPEAPDGTMQALVARAVEEAAVEGAGRLSLAALPAPVAAGAVPGLAPVAALAARLAARFGRGRRVDGLAQFKAGFAPRAEPLYIAAPSWPALALAALDILREVHHPPPLPDAAATAAGAESAEGARVASCPPPGPLRPSAA